MYASVTAVTKCGSIQAGNGREKERGKRECNGSRQKNSKRDRKVESNDSPVIPDRGETSNIPSFPSEVVTTAQLIS